MNMWMSNMSRSCRSLKSTVLALSLLTGGALTADPVEATIVSPTGSITVPMGQTVGLSATSSDGGKLNYSVNSYGWSCTDGWTGSGPSASHLFPIAGTYTVTLTVAYSYQICKSWDLDGNCLSYLTKTGTATASRIITVTPASIGPISPANASVNAGSSIQFYTSVTGAVNTGVAWSVSGGGSINSGGLFTASTAGTFTVTARAAADSGKASSAQITVNSVVTGVVVTPSSVSLKAGESTAFTAQVQGLGGPSQGVTWSASGDSVATNGVYTAPVAGGTYTVTARSTQDTSKSGPATVYVSTITVGVPAPANTSVYAGNSIQYSANVSGAVATGLSWTVSGGGSISASGLFTSTTPGAYTVTATSQADGVTANSTPVTVLGLGVNLAGSKTIPYGGSTTLTPAFATGNGVLNPGSLPVTSGTPVSVGPLTATAAYVLTVTNGAYTAPPTGATVSVSTVSVSGPTPVGATVKVGGQLQFTATVNGAMNSGITWLVSGGGTINASGLFNATTVGGPYTVTATSQADGTKFGSTSVTVGDLGVSLAESRTISYGGSTTLTPAFSAGSGVLNPGNLTVTSGVPVSVGPLTSTTVYTLTVTNGGYSTPASATVTITPVTVSPVFPANATVSVGSQLQFVATVAGAVNPVVTWSVSSGGTINAATGLFTAATEGGPFVVTATSVANTSVASSTLVTVGGLGVSLGGSKTIPYGGTTTLTPSFADGTGVLNPGSLSVISGTAVTVGPLTTTTDYLLTVTNGAVSNVASARVTITDVVVAAPSPANASVSAGTTLVFSAVVDGAVDGRVFWSVSGGGSINPTSGLFAAERAGTYTVTATSRADGSTNASTSVTVIAVISSVNVSPASASLNPGASLQFNASVVGLGITNSGVTWASSGGTMGSDGTFTAPIQSGDVTITANSQQDPTKVGSATVRVKGWVTRWKRDVVYVGTKEIAEIDSQGVHVTLVDHLGSPRFMVNGAGVVEAEQKFLPFGEALADSSNRAKFAKGFTNHEQTDPSELIYMQARFYAPWYGRFLSPDPARDQHFEETQSWNIYSYVRNNPVTHIDPNGMEDYPIFDMPQMRVLSLTQSGIPGGRAEQMVAREQQQRTVAGGTATAALATGGLASSPVGAAIAGAGRAALGWMASTGAALYQQGKELLSRGSQAAQTEQSVSDKLSRYLLNPEHPVGGSKAQWFKEALGFTKDNMADLAKQVKFDPSTATQTGATEFGTKFNQTISITGANGKTIDMTFAWIKNKDNVVRLVTAIPEKKKN